MSEEIVNNIYICPACGKILKQVTIRGIELDACIDGCGGVWFDAAELFRLDEPEEGIDDPILKKLIELGGTKPRDSENVKYCIKCNMKMRRHEYRENSNIFIDECYGCGGIWLDGGELKAIRESIAVKQSNLERKILEQEFSKRVQKETEERLKGIKRPNRE